MNSADRHAISSIDDCQLINIPAIRHDNGNIAVMENVATALFEIRRVYYIYDIQSGAERGGHSHHNTSELVIPLSGSFDVVIDDGVATRRITLNRPDTGLLLSTGIWRTLDNFSTGSICLVLASEKYCEDDYVRSYEEFKHLTAAKQ